MKGTVIIEEVGRALEKIDKAVLGRAAEAVLTKVQPQLSEIKVSCKVDGIKGRPENDEEKVKEDIVKRPLSYPFKLITKNIGVNGSVVSEKVLASDHQNYRYNAAIGNYEDLMAAGIIDPTKESK
ncbi:hypothetical protein AgCh_001209 [Apium graveolens]